MKEFWKSLNIWGSYEQEFSVLFFETQCVTRCMQKVSTNKNVYFHLFVWYNYDTLNTESTHTHARTHTHTHTTRVSRYQKGKTNQDFTEARDSEWQWHQLGRMQVCNSLQTDNHASNPTTQFFYRPDALPATQPTASKHWRHMNTESTVELKLKL